MPFAQLPGELARELVDINALAPVLLTRAVIPAMIKQRHGAVINVASLLAFSGAARAPHLPNRAVYAATKAFLVTFTEILAGELDESMKARFDDAAVALLSVARSAQLPPRYGSD